jgi:hypothetical protein
MTSWLRFSALATSLLAVGCFTPTAVRRIAHGSEKQLLSLERDTDDSNLVHWVERRWGPEPELWATHARLEGSVRLPEPPSDCGRWQIAALPGTDGFRWSGPGEREHMVASRTQFLEYRGGEVPPPEPRPGCTLRIGWFPTAPGGDSLRLGLPSGEQRELVSLPGDGGDVTAKVAANLVLSPFVDVLLVPATPFVLGLMWLVGVRC